MSSRGKEAKNVIRILERNGWEIDRRRKRPIAKAPDGSTSVPISLSPGDHHWLRNLKKQIAHQYGPVPGLHD